MAIFNPAGTVAVTQAQINAGNVVIKATPGMLCTILVTTTMTGAGVAITFFDNATTAAGTVIGIVPALTAAGTIFSLIIPAINGITIGQQAGLTAGSFTVSIN